MRDVMSKFRRCRLNGVTTIEKTNMYIHIYTQIELQTQRDRYKYPAEYLKKISYSSRFWILNSKCLQNRALEKRKIILFQVKFQSRYMLFFLSGGHLEYFQLAKDVLNTLLKKKLDQTLFGSANFGTFAAGLILFLHKM